MLQQLTDLHALRNVPDPHRWQVTALGRGRDQGWRQTERAGPEMEADIHKSNQFNKNLKAPIFSF